MCAAVCGDDPIYDIVITIKINDASSPPFLLDVVTGTKINERNSGGFPGLIKEPLSHIRGELYEVDDVVLKRLDWLEGHPDFYCREEIETFEDGTPIITYIFNHSPRQKYTILEEGVWP